MVDRYIDIWTYIDEGQIDLDIGNQQLDKLQLLDR